MASLAERLRHDRPMVLVGHDWGAAVAYAMAGSAPEVVERAVTMAVPHPSILGTALLSDFAQQKRSWYMYFFQLAGIAEAVVGMDDHAFLDRLVADWSPGWEVPESYRRHVRAAIGQPANLSVALGYYRAMFDPATGLGPASPIGTPTLLLMGADDGCIGADIARRPAPIFTGEYEVEVLDGCGHFLLQEKPDEAIRRVLDWLRPG
jgi:pimeloyl-ACP methyl ester carboxylesterase